MRVIEITGPRQARLVERPDPKVADNYALVRIEAAPMCTEWHGYRDGRRSDRLGHEAAGVVVARGHNCSIADGTRVVVMPQDACGACHLCRSGNYIRCQTPRDPFAECGSETGRATYAELCIQQDWLLLPIPDDVSTFHASLACCALGPAFGAMRRLEVGAGDTVLVSGLGPVGLGAVICATARGARVIGLEPSAYRAELARSLGAEAVIDPTMNDPIGAIRAMTGGHGVDKSVETSSQEAAPAMVFAATRVGGQMASIGWGGPVNMRDVVGRGVSIFGQWHWDHVAHGAEMFDLIRRTRPALDRQVTHRFPLAAASAAFELQMTGRCGKVVLEP